MVLSSKLIIFFLLAIRLILAVDCFAVRSLLLLFLGIRVTGVGFKLSTCLWFVS